jgi:hypothetical protein
MSITTIARQAQGLRAGQVIAKLTEDAYFMRVNTRVAQPPPVRNRDNEATSRSADAGRNRSRAELPANPNRTRATAGGHLKLATEEQPLTAIARSSLIANPAAEVATAEAPTTGLTGGPAAEAIAATLATRTATPPEPHRAATTPARRLRSYGARRLPRQATTTASLPSLRDLVTSSS